MTTTVAFYNTESGAVWVQPITGEARQLRKAADKSDAYTAIGEAGLVRVGNWLPAYGPVMSALLASTKRVTVTLTVPLDVQPLDVAERLEMLLDQTQGWTVTDSTLVR